MTIDYDMLACQYSLHRRTHPGVLQNIIETSLLKPPHAVLEVGCGTGNYILALQAAVGCRSWGIDPSQKMLAFASRRSSAVIFRPGEAASLPFGEDMFNLLFSVDVIHHLDDPGSYFNEAWRVLKPGGLLCTVTESAALLSSRVPLAKYFPETVHAELRRYPRIEDLHLLMEEAGFFEREEVIVRHPYEIESLEPYKNKAFSALHVIPEDAFHRGLERMRKDLENGPIQAVSHYLLLWGKKINP